MMLPGLRLLLKYLLISSVCFSAVTAWAGGSPRQISGPHEGNCFTPQFSPDGKQVAYEVNYYERRMIELYVHNLESDRESLVSAVSGGSGLLGEFGKSSGQGQVTYELAWHPRQSAMYVFASSGGDENFDVYLSGGSVLAPDPAADGMAVWSGDGKFIAFTSSRTGEGDLYLIDVNKTDEPPARLTNNPEATEWYPTWSRVGRQLLFVQHYSRGGDNLFLIKDITSPQNSIVQLTDWSSIQTKPAWSPDGRRIAFYSNKKLKERYDLYVMEPKAGAQPRMVLEGVMPNERLGPTWAPNGKAILAVKEDPERFNPIRLVSADAPGQLKIVSTGTQNNSDLHLVTTKDEQSWLAFTAQGRIGDSRKAFKQVYVYPLDKNDLSFQ